MATVAMETTKNTKNLKCSELDETFQKFCLTCVNNFFNFYIGGHFEMAAILKILKTKSTTLSDDLFLCQVSKGSAVWSEFNIFCTLVTMATAAIFEFV
jgi:hypothetical protein